MSDVNLEILGKNDRQQSHINRLKPAYDPTVWKSGSWPKRQRREMPVRDKYSSQKDEDMSQAVKLDPTHWLVISYWGRFRTLTTVRLARPTSIYPHSLSGTIQSSPFRRGFASLCTWRHHLLATWHSANETRNPDKQDQNPCDAVSDEKLFSRIDYQSMSFYNILLYSTLNLVRKSLCFRIPPECSNGRPTNPTCKPKRAVF